MFHVSILSIILIFAASGHPLYFKDKQIKVDVSSARKNKNIQLLISINAPINTQFILEAESFDAKHKSHKLKVKQNQVLIEPKMKDQIILMNQISGGQHRIAFAHQMNTKDFQFVSLVISHGDEHKKLILPSLNMKMNHLHQNFLYKCHNLLVSIQLDNNLQHVQLNLFTTDRKQSIWILDSGWKNSWRNADNQVFYGGAHKQNKITQFTINLISGKYCNINLNNLPKNDKLVPPKKYYKVKDLLDWAPALKVSQQSINEEL